MNTRSLAHSFTSSLTHCLPMSFLSSSFRLSTSCLVSVFRYHFSLTLILSLSLSPSISLCLSLCLSVSLLSLFRPPSLCLLICAFLHFSSLPASSFHSLHLLHLDLCLQAPLFLVCRSFCLFMSLMFSLLPFVSRSLIVFCLFFMFSWI